MKFISLFFILIFTLAYVGISCAPPGSSSLSSEDNDDDDDDDDDDRGNRRTRECASRDSCQDICDDMFNYTSEHSKCYDLSYDEVNTISKVWDELSENKVDSGELEDLDADDVRAYFEIGFESFIDLVKGEAVGDSAKDSRNGSGPQWDPEEEDNSKAAACKTNDNCIAQNSRKIMQWIAEEESIAEVILEQDRNFELGLELFQTINWTSGSRGYVLVKGGTPDFFDPTWKNINIISGSDHYVCFDQNFAGSDTNTRIIETIKYDDNSDTCASPEKQLKVRFDRVSRFLSGFLVGSNDGSEQIEEFGDESFMTFSAEERNEKAFEWGHKTLLEFCKEATDEDEDDVDVKTCLQTVYCMHEKVNDDGIFDDLEDHEDIVGRTDKRYCANLAEERRMEDLFD